MRSTRGERERESRKMGREGSKSEINVKESERGGKKVENKKKKGVKDIKN